MTTIFTYNDKMSTLKKIFLPMIQTKYPNLIPMKLVSYGSHDNGNYRSEWIECDWKETNTYWYHTDDMYIEVEIRYDGVNYFSAQKSDGRIIAQARCGYNIDNWYYVDEYNVFWSEKECRDAFDAYKKLLMEKKSGSLSGQNKLLVANIKKLLYTIIPTEVRYRRDFEMKQDREKKGSFYDNYAGKREGKGYRFRFIGALDCAYPLWDKIKNKIIERGVKIEGMTLEEAHNSLIEIENIMMNYSLTA